MMRIQKYLSQQGICSRRKAEEFIRNGWVLLNQQVVTELGVLIDPVNDKIEVNEEAKLALKQLIYLKFNKPRGVVTHSPQQGERDIKSFLPEKYHHCAPVGRLDKESEGLILLTNDGVFTRRLLDSNNPHERVYIVTVNKPLLIDDINKLEQGVFLMGKETKPCKINRLSPRQYKFFLKEGRNRQIRRMIQKVGSHVTKLKRVSFAHYSLNDLKEGCFIEFFENV